MGSGVPFIKISLFSLLIYLVRGSDIAKYYHRKMLFMSLRVIDKDVD